MFDLFQHVTAAILALVKILRRRKPGKVFLLLKREEDSMLKFVLVLPEIGAADVVKRQVALQIGSEEPQNLEIGPDELETQEFSGSDGDIVSGSLVEVDDAGNSSEPRDFEFVLTDTLVPPQPGQLGLRVTEETSDPVEPPVDEPTA